MMRKEISPELYNYNRFPGPEFTLADGRVFTDKFEFVIVDNYKDAFDLTAFHQRFSEILNKFDYIVGDWGNEQLRLRGFYKDEKALVNNEKISRLDDYLLEYCNYGCAYFVLENLRPQRAAFDKKSHRRKERDGKRERDSRSKRPRRRRSDYYEDSREREWERRSRRDNKHPRSHSKQTRQKKDNSRHFVIRQK